VEKSSLVFGTKVAMVKNIPRFGCDWHKNDRGKNISIAIAKKIIVVKRERISVLTDRKIIEVKREPFLG
jgi:hypothetical protein